MIRWVKNPKHIKSYTLECNGNLLDKIIYCQKCNKEILAPLNEIQELSFLEYRKLNLGDHIQPNMNLCLLCNKT